MRRIFALAISLAVLIVTPGLAGAEPSRWPGNTQQAINTVIQRALSQRGVPYTYGGGNVSGPSRRPDPQPAPAPAQTAGQTPGLTAGQTPGLTAGQTPGLTAGQTPGLTPGLVFPATGAGPLATPDPTANVVGFDASGLVVYAFAGAGIKMPRSSGEQYKVGRKVLPSQALPGDLIFYGPEGTQSVALFIGNGQMVEATEPAVTVSPVRTKDMAPYLTRIIG
jgi:cell wall-associated NlpC family hydrolase